MKEIKTTWEFAGLSLYCKINDFRFANISYLEDRKMFLMEILIYEMGERYDSYDDMISELKEEAQEFVRQITLEDCLIWSKVPEESVLVNARAMYGMEPSSKKIQPQIVKPEEEGWLTFEEKIPSDNISSLFWIKYLKNEEKCIHPQPCHWDSYRQVFIDHSRTEFIHNIVIQYSPCYVPPFSVLNSDWVQFKHKTPQSGATVWFRHRGDYYNQFKLFEYDASDTFLASYRNDYWKSYELPVIFKDN